jgi:hypothetical protein
LADRALRSGIIFPTRAARSFARQMDVAQPFGFSPVQARRLFLGIRPLSRIIRPRVIAAAGIPFALIAQQRIPVTAPVTARSAAPRSQQDKKQRRTASAKGLNGHFQSLDKAATAIFIPKPTRPRRWKWRPNMQAKASMPEDACADCVL